MQKVLLQGREYLVNESGEIFNSHHHKMKPYVDKHGYHSLLVNRKRFLVHRVVAHAYFGTPLNGRELQVHHKNGDKNNNSVVNLETLTTQEHQHLHKQKHPLAKRCIVCGKSFVPKPTKRARAKTCGYSCWYITTKINAEKRSRAIKRINPITGETKEFKSILEGAISINKNKKSISNITTCASGKIHTAYGYIWEYI